MMDEHVPELLEVLERVVAAAHGLARVEWSGATSVTTGSA